MRICRQCKATFNAKNWQCPVCKFEPEIVSGYYSLNPNLDKDLGFKQESFEQYYELEAGSFWFRSRNHLINWVIGNYFFDAKNFLEIGCGTGFVLSGIQEAFPNLNISGSDISITGLTFAAKRLNKNIEMVQFDAHQIPFKNEFDLIGAFDVLEHVESTEEVLKQMHKATARGGGIILTVPQHQFLWSQFDEFACHKRRYSAKEIKKNIASAGFDIIRLTSFVSLLFPAMVLSRGLKKLRYNDYEALTELKLPGYLNYLFEKICDFERLIIKLGVNLPFGGSLLIVARKA